MASPAPQQPKPLTQVIGSIIRHLLTACGGGFVVAGSASDDQVDMILGGVVLFLLGQGLSWLEKRRRPASPVNTGEAAQ